jgi:hypothetical protein
MAALPILAAPSALGANLVPTIVDPMLVNGSVDMNATKANLRAAIVNAAAQNGEPLRDDWSNFFACTHACNVLFDLSKIWAEADSDADIRQLALKWYSKITASEAQEWTLESACQEHTHFDLDSMFSKQFTNVFDFMGQSLAFSPHAVALLFEDNHLSLLRNTFCVSDGCAKFAAGRPRCRTCPP